MPRLARGIFLGGFLVYELVSRFGVAVSRGAFAVLMAFVLLFCSTALLLWSVEFNWHDQQRGAQLLLLVAAAPLTLLVSPFRLSLSAMGMLAGIFALGLLSSLHSAWPEWALLEWAHCIGLVLLALLVAGLARDERVARSLVALMLLVGSVQAMKFLLAYLMAFVTGIQNLEAMMMIDGFIHVRFFGQFQAMLLPLLAAAVVWCRLQGRIRLAICLLVVLVLQWCITYVLGGRGLWIGLLVGHLVLWWVLPRFRSLFCVQALAALMGLILFALMFFLIPWWQGIDVLRIDGLRTSLSSRNVLWPLAWEMAVNHPWLGVGPMHFSAFRNPVAAHPHEVLLQWASEWGFIATGMALVLVLKGLFRGRRFLGGGTAGILDGGLAVAILCSLVLALMDGVFVMPYTETWLAVLIGLAMARCAGEMSVTCVQKPLVMILVLSVLLVLVPLLAGHIPLSPFYDAASLQHSSSGLNPRFWKNGWIPWPSD